MEASANMYYFLVDSTTKYLMGSTDGDNGVAFYQGTVRFRVWNPYEMDVGLRNLVDEADEDVRTSKWKTPGDSTKYLHCEFMKNNFLADELPKGDRKASFVQFKDFAEGWYKFRCLMNVRHKRFPLAYAFIYHLELKVFLLCIERITRFVVTPLELSNLGCAGLDVFNYPPEVRQLDVKEICQAFQHALGRKMSIGGLNNLENYVLCEDTIKILWPYDCSAESAIRGDLESFKDGVDKILFPGNFKLKIHFMECFDLVIVNHPDGLEVLIEHTILKTKMYDVLLVLWKADHLVSNQNILHRYFDIQSLSEYITVTSTPFQVEICQKQKSWVHNPKGISPLLQAIITQQNARTPQEKSLLFEHLCKSHLRTPQSMLTSLRGVFQHLDETNSSPKTLFRDVEKNWQDFIPRLHAKMYHRTASWKPLWMVEESAGIPKLPPINFYGQRETRLQQIRAQALLDRPGRIYVGKLDQSVDNYDLKELFSKHGTVVYVNVVRGKGHGYITMSNVVERNSAIDGLNGKSFKGRKIAVQKHRDEPD